MIFSVVTDVLKSLYTDLGNALIIAIFFMYVYLSYRSIGLKKTINIWLEYYKIDKKFRDVFFLALYVAMILARTVLARSYWEVRPLTNIVGIWGLYDNDGNLYTENIDNIILFIPFTFLLMRVLEKKDSTTKCIWNGVKLSFGFSICIEFLQLFFKLGTFQLSDLFFNTIGGTFGSLMYSVWCKMKNRKHN